MFSYDHVGSSRVSQLSDVSPKDAPKRKTGHFNASLRKHFQKQAVRHQAAPLLPPTKLRQRTLNLNLKTMNHQAAAICSVMIMQVHHE